MVLLGYFLTDLIDKPLQGLFGLPPEFTVRNHVEKVIILVVLASISPGIYAWLRARWLAWRSRSAVQSLASPVANPPANGQVSEHMAEPVAAKKAV
jgi:hypothetical protein